MNENNLDNAKDRKTLYSDKITYDVDSLVNAFNYLMQLQELEDIPKYGKLKYEGEKSKRYIMDEYVDTIDSTFYTDMATSTLAYTMKFFAERFGEVYSEVYSDGVYYDGVYNAICRYFTDGSHDLTNDSEGEFANFEGDDSLFDANLDIDESLYAYYNEFQLVTGEQEQDLINNNLFNEKEDKGRIALKRTDKINDGEIDFYYVGFDFYDISDNLLQHDYNVKFLSEKDIPKKVLESGKDNDIITLTRGYYENTDRNPAAVAYTIKAGEHRGNIIVKADWFTDAICHELGHRFDRGIEYNSLSPLMPIPKNFFRNETWNRLVETYAEQLSTFIPGAGTCDPSFLIEYPHEFYARVFHTYFYSPETRATLPAKVRKQIEAEINKYTN